jgi:hypothetical protein
VNDSRRSLGTKVVEVVEMCEGEVIDGDAG